MGGQRLSTARERDHHLTGTVCRGGAFSHGDGNPNGFLACGFIRKLSGGSPAGYPPGFGMDRIGKGDCRTFLRVDLALGISLIWSIPSGAFIGTDPPPATGLPPIAPGVSTLPGSALFSGVLLALLPVPGRF